MNRVSRLPLVALAIAAAVPLAGVPLLGGSAMAQAIAPAVGKPLQQALNAAKAGNTAAATNYVNQARSAATTNAERTKVSQTAAYVYTRAGNYGAAATELERVGAPASQLAPLYYQARQYDKAIATAKTIGMARRVRTSQSRSPSASSSTTPPKPATSAAVGRAAPIMAGRPGT